MFFRLFAIISITKIWAMAQLLNKLYVKHFLRDSIIHGSIIFNYLNK
ncbi:hypothetical protein EW15_0543 [Prochlorococcus sp. MIT 0801]|nr:hypothetical protein EW15_0543 [Prochlorococcus sp. MIT 0801]